MNTDFLIAMKIFFESGETRRYDFRRKQLVILKKTVEKYEAEIFAALQNDLKKSKEESFASEVGLFYAEINYALKNLRAWMKPQTASTNLVNLPSTSKIYRDSLGVVLIISPWNYPFQLLFIPLVGAIAGGNCVVLKPSEFAASTALIMQKIVEEIFDERYIKIINGDGNEVVNAMMNDFRFNHIFYTGSVEVGRSIYKKAAEDLIPVTLELGGKSPCIVEADANLIVAARRIVLGKFINAGQTCIAPDYILVHENVKDELVRKMKFYIEKFYGKDANESYDYGKIINQKRFDSLIKYIGDGNILHGGKSDAAMLFIEPTLIDELKENASAMKEEIFGPILPIISFKERNEAMKIVKQYANPLAFYLFTSNKKTACEWIANVAFGGGCINNTVWQNASHSLPFGGVGNSGIGAYHGKYSFDIFTRLKPVLNTPTWFDPAMKYPSYKGKMKLLKFLFK